MAKAQSLRALFDNMDKEVRKETMSKNAVFMVSIDLLLEDPGFNTREYETERVQAKIREYADAFLRGDVFPPVMVKVVDEQIFIRDGYLRTRGARLAISEGGEIDRLACLEVAGDEGVQDLVILKSNDGLKLLPLERAAVYSRMMHTRGMSVEEIAKLDGRTTTSITQYITAYNMPLELKRLINSDVVSMSYAVGLFTEHGTKAVDLIKAHLGAQQVAQEETTDLLGIQKPAPKTKRITAKAMESVTGYRARFTPDLVKNVTDSLRSLKATLDNAKAEDDHVEVRFTKEQYESFLKLAAEVEPKPAKAKVEAESDGTEAQ